MYNTQTHTALQCTAEHCIPLWNPVFTDAATGSRRSNYLEHFAVPLAQEGPLSYPKRACRYLGSALPPPVPGLWSPIAPFPIKLGVLLCFTMPHALHEEHTVYPPLTHHTPLKHTWSRAFHNSGNPYRSPFIHQGRYVMVWWWSHWLCWFLAAGRALASASVRLPA